MPRHFHNLLTSIKKRPVLLLVPICIVVLVVVLLLHIQHPKRSVAAYCSVFKQEKARLAKLPGDTWSSTVFNDDISDAGQFAVSFGRLDRVAPADIEPDVATLQSVYQKIHDDPADAVSASLSGIGAEDSVQSWTEGHCTE